VAENVDGIGKLLVMDSDAGVRRAAAFALGQIQHPSCERILLGAIVKEKADSAAFEILQAYGKATSLWNLNAEGFLSDSVRSSGLAWSIYRAGLRGKTDAKANAVAMQLLEKHLSESARLGAAHYFARGAKDFSQAAQSLAGSASGDPSSEVRMASALALGKIPSDSILIVLKNIIKTDKDSRVVTGAIRALRSFAYDHVKHYLYEALMHKDANVGIAASEIILETLPADQWIDVSSVINRIGHWRVAANLYEAALKAGRNKDLAHEIEQRYTRASDPYERASLLGALKHYAPAFQFVARELDKADTAVVRSSAAAALAAMSNIKDLTTSERSRFAQSYKAVMISQQDPAVLGTIAATLADSALQFRSILKDASFLHDVKRRLQLPEDNEALQSVEAAIAHFEGRKPVTVENEFNHPIDWELVRQIPEGHQVIIKTTRGNIVMRLLVNESPGSVGNFIGLAMKDYFDQKFFHRVVPNFVVQAGCKRGDGWGSEDYSIRSEFTPRLYRTGSVGMASAGKDTEGTQWFITHSPTPHLDGRYTIFAEVVEGMQVVNYIQVGDKITDVVIGDFKGQ
jgi:cyclophilin family peptidyl-prolyl cis-trans isomerase/HEAT repeat protein